jgi:hypothetical protein
MLSLTTYNTNIDALAQQCIPVHRRKSVLVSFVMVLVSQIKALQSQFYALMQSQYDMLAFTGQVCYLQYLLNRNYGPDITIEDASMFDDVYEFTWGETGYDTAGTEGKLFEYAIEDEPIVAPAHDYMYYQTDDYATQKAFVVNVPTANTHINEIQAMVERYRLPSKRFEIILIVP